MKKIISVFQRDYEGTRQVFDAVVPGAEWVLAGEGVATPKWDGSACLITRGVLFRRYDAKLGKVPPAAFIAAQDPDRTTGHWPGWLRVEDGPADRWHREALANSKASEALLDWTYELVGPKINGNPHGYLQHALIRHGAPIVGCDIPPRSFAGLRRWLEANTAIEGLVFWRDPGDPDCDKAKIKRKDFGLPWPVQRDCRCGGAADLLPCAGTCGREVVA